MPTTYQEVERVYEVSERCCMISRARNTRSYMPTRYQDGLQDLTGSANQIVHAYEDQDGAAGSHGFGTTDPTCLRGIKTGLQDLTGSEDQLVHT